MKRIGHPEPGTYKVLVSRKLRSGPGQKWVPALVREVRQHEGAKRRLVCLVNGHIVSLTQWWPALYPITRDEYRELLNEQDRPSRNWQHDRATAGRERSRI